MYQIIGFLIVLTLVFGALASAGTGVLYALPFELSLIGGAALATLIIGNAPSVWVGALRGLGAAVVGPKWTRADYTDVLTLIHGLCTDIRRGGHIAIETDIEAPETSARFGRFARLMKDPDVPDLICNGFRLMSLDLSDPTRCEDAMVRQVSAREDERFRSVAALRTVADALPALGIVAAVIGIIRAMAVIDQAPEVMGALIASALLGTFLGVFLAYGVVGPLAQRFEQVLEEEFDMLEVIRVALTSFAKGASPLTAIEIARTMVPGHLQPEPDTVSRALQSARFAASADARAA